MVVSFYNIPMNHKKGPAETIEIIFSTELMQKIKIEDRGVHGSKIEGGRINHGGASGGKAPGNGENGNNAGSASPNTQGGAAVIPVYAAGAANNNHHHRNQHGAGHCNVNRIKFPILLMIIWVNTLIQLCLLV